MERYPLIQRWGDSPHLNMVTDSRGVRYIPFAKIAYLEVVDSEIEQDYPEWETQDVQSPPLWEDSESVRNQGGGLQRTTFTRDPSPFSRRSHDSGSIQNQEVTRRSAFVRAQPSRRSHDSISYRNQDVTRRPAFTRDQPSRRSHDSILLRNQGPIIRRPAFPVDQSSRTSYDFEIPRPIVIPRWNTATKYRRQFGTVREARSAAPVARVKPREKFVYTSAHERPASARDSRGYWSVLSRNDQEFKPRFRYKNIEIYPPKRVVDGIIGKKRQLIKEAIASTDSEFDFYGRQSLDHGGKISPNPIFLPGRRLSSADTNPIPDRTYIRTVKPFNSEYHFRSPTPPIPERRYYDTELEPATSAISAFTPFEGQIASRNRTSILAQWQDTIHRPIPRKHVLLDSTQRLYDIEENPDY